MDAKICLRQHLKQIGMECKKNVKFRCKQCWEQGWRIRGFKGAQAASTSFPKAPPESKAKCTLTSFYEINENTYN